MFGALPKGSAHFFGVLMRTTKPGGKDGTHADAGQEGVRRSRKELISGLLSRMEEQLDPKTTKVTLADFIRLIQLQRELEKEEQPAEVIVTWRDLSETQSTV